MRDEYVALHDLQQLDSQVLEVERSAQQIPKKIGEIEEEVDILRTEVGAANADLQSLRREVNELEGTVAEESAKHQHWKQRLNKIANSREYQALSREIEQGERMVRGHEEKLLELGQALETKEKDVAEQEADLRNREAEVRAKVAELRDAQAKLRQDAEAAQAGREDLLKRVPPRVLKKYEQLRKRLGGIAVAVVREGACSGCNMQLRPQQVVELLRATAWQSCPTCHRLLVHESHVNGSGEG